MSDHSFIISMDDENLKNLFTKEELSEMTAASRKHVLEAALPAHLEELLKNLSRKSTFAEIENCFNTFSYSRISHPEEQWIVRSVLDYIDLFFDADTARKFNSEASLFQEMYAMIVNMKKISRTVGEL